MNNLKGITDLETKLIWFEPKLFWSGQNISIKKSPTDTTQTRYLDGARLKRISRWGTSNFDGARLKSPTDTTQTRYLDGARLKRISRWGTSNL